MNTKKTFDCVEMKHVGAEQIRKQTVGMTRQQLLEFWRQRSQALREHQQQLMRQSPAQSVVLQSFSKTHSAD